MKKKPAKLSSLLIAALITLFSFTGCGADSTTASLTAGSSSESTPTTGITAIYSSEDLDSSWDASSATIITLKGDSFSVSGSGATSAGRVLTITAAGTYVFSGTLNDGQIIVFAGKEDTVHLVLNGAQLSCSNSAAIYSQQSKKTIITLAEGSSNTVEDGTVYTYAEGEDEPDAAIFSKDDLTINGSGSLSVTGNYNNGIGTKDDLVITGGSITVDAANDGLRGRDSIAINDGSLVIEAGGDGIQANNDEDADKGWISLDGGVFNITAGSDGIQAETLLQVTDGEFTLNTGGGSVNASTDGSGGTNPDWGRRVVPDVEDTDEEDTVSSKGIKAGTGITISGGVFSIDSSDDSIHCNGEILINAGDIKISSGDDGIHADTSLTVNEGSIVITKSYEGLESRSITINDGAVSITARDDGLNSAGGNDGSSMGRTGENNFSSDGSSYIRITGGYVYIDAYGDGIDSNGALYFDGGTVLVNGPTNNGNGAIDYMGSCEVTGGVLAIAGSSGMAQAPGNTSSQNSLMVYYSSTQKAGTLVNLVDEGGNTIITFAPCKDYQVIVISTPELEQGKTYTLSSGGTCSGQNKDGMYTSGTCSGSTELTDVTISGTVTTISDDGSQVTGGMGGMKGQGGQGGQNGPGGRQMPSGNAPTTAK